MSVLPKYALITPARNEAQFIALTLESMTQQNAKPVLWVIVSDGSTDGTDKIVRDFAAVNPWIELLRMPERSERHFAGKVHAFNAGYKRLDGLDYEVIGSLDADISFDGDYFSFLLRKLSADPTLGVVGTPFVEASSRVYDYRFTNIEHVSGACQLFRRQCFEQIGGYMPIKGGCIDHVAVISARMKGWKTRTFPQRTCVHHRSMGTAEQSVLQAKFTNGRKDYSIGNHPLWEFFRSCYQMTHKPFVIGGLLIFVGYVWAALLRAERPVSHNLVAFVRQEQIGRLWKILRRKLFRTGSALESPLERA